MLAKWYAMDTPRYKGTCFRGAAWANVEWNDSMLLLVVGYDFMMSSGLACVMADSMMRCARAFHHVVQFFAAGKRFFDLCDHLVCRHQPVLCVQRGSLPFESQILEFFPFGVVRVHIKTHSLNGLPIMKTASLAVHFHKLRAKSTSCMQKIELTIVTLVLVQLTQDELAVGHAQPDELSVTEVHDKPSQLKVRFTAPYLENLWVELEEVVKVPCIVHGCQTSQPCGHDWDCHLPFKVVDRGIELIILFFSLLANYKLFFLLLYSCFLVFISGFCVLSC